MTAMSQLAGDTVIFLTGDYLTASVEDEVVLLDTQTGTYYGVNAVGAHILDIMEMESISVDRIVTSVVERYEIPRERAEADVISYLDDLISEGVVEIANEP